MRENVWRLRFGRSERLNAVQSTVAAARRIEYVGEEGQIGENGSEGVLAAVDALLGLERVQSMLERVAQKRLEISETKAVEFTCLKGDTQLRCGGSSAKSEAMKTGD